MSSNTIKLTFKLDPENAVLARRNLQKGGKVQKYIDSEVLRYSAPYIPHDTGTLLESGDDATVKGSGMVHWDTPYARKNYYENRGRGTDGTAKGGLRGKLWFERMKRDHLPAILRGVKKIAGAK